MVAVYINGFGIIRYIIINNYHSRNYYKGPGNIKFRCIIMILFNTGLEIGTK